MHYSNYKEARNIQETSQMCRDVPLTEREREKNLLEKHTYVILCEKVLLSYASCLETAVDRGSSGFPLFASLCLPVRHR